MRTLRLIQDGVATATLTVPEGVPGHVVAWAQAKIAEDLLTHATEPRVSYLQTAHALGRTTAEAVDAKVHARVFAEPTRTYREHLVDVLREDEELAQAYRESAV